MTEKSPSLYWYESQLEWCYERIAEHVGSVHTLESLGKEGKMFDLGNGLAQLRHMLLANHDHLRSVIMDIPHNRQEGSGE